MQWENFYALMGNSTGELMALFLVVIANCFSSEITDDACNTD